MEYTTILLEEQGDVKIIHVTQPRIFLDITEKFREEILQVMQENISKLILDISEVHVMNSSGLGVLLTIRDRLNRHGGRFAIVGLQPIMKDIFIRMKLNDFFNVYESRALALAHLEV